MIRAVVAALALVAGCGGADVRERGRPVEVVVESLDGGDVVLSAHRGRPIVLHVFATWAPAAHTDADQLNALHRARSRDVTVIGIALDPEGHRFVAPWRAAVGARYVVALASDVIRRGESALGPLRQVPVTFLIDRRGRIAGRIDRPLADGELAKLVSRLLEE